jgi:hypothetical protein
MNINVTKILWTGKNYKTVQDKLTKLNIPFSITQNELYAPSYIEHNSVIYACKEFGIIQIEKTTNKYIDYI